MSSDGYGSFQADPVPVMVMVSGSRGWTDRDAIRRAFTGWWEAVTYASPNPISTVTLMHGDACGADRMAADVATELGWNVIAVPADWDRHRRGAGILRNLAMLEHHLAHVFIFWDGKSRGTKHVIDEVQKRRQSYQIESSDQKDFFDRPPPDAAELAERAEWDVTLMDGIEPESFDQTDSVEGADERVL